MDTFRPLSFDDARLAEAAFAGYRLIAAHDPIRAEEQTARRRSRIAEMEATAEKIVARLDAQDEGPTARGRRASDRGAYNRFTRAVAEAEMTRFLKAALEEALQSFASVQFDAAVRAVRTIEAADPPQSELLQFARARADAVASASRLIRAWRDFLVAAEADVARKREEAGVEELNQNARRVRVALESLCKELRALGNAP